MFYGTLLDGELVWETGADDGLGIDEGVESQRLAFWAFDSPRVAGVSLRELGYRERHACVVSTLHVSTGHPNLPPKIAEERARELAEKGLIIACPRHQHRLCLMAKPWRPARELDALRDACQRNPALGHPCDGFILTPLHEPVRINAHETQFKWKEVHTIDLELW